MDDIINLSEVNKPFVIRCDRLNSWPCFQWSLKDWSEKCGSTKLSFRIHKRSSETFWENEAIDRFETSLNYYIQWNEFDVNGCDSENPFVKYPKENYWAYSSYNYLGKIFANNIEIMESVKWSQLELDSKLDSNAMNSTLWIGSEGAFTPCHQDSYGYNFVAQLSGKKLWILFPPTDSKYLYPTRIPYEESSVFSSVNFQCPDLERHPLFQLTSPHIIELKAGDILFVPHLWWHFVRIIEEDSQKSCISINNWIFNDSFETSLRESIVRFLTTGLFKTYCPTEPIKWLNTGADLFTPEEAVHLVDLMLKKCNSNKTTTELNSVQKQVFPQNWFFIDSSDFKDMTKLFDEKTFKKFKSEQQIQRNDYDLSPESIVNCILDPEVIQLIAQKLQKL